MWGFNLTRGLAVAETLTMNLRGLTAAGSVGLWVLLAACARGQVPATNAPGAGGAVSVSSPAPVMAATAPPVTVPPLVKPGGGSPFMTTPSLYVPDMTHAGEPMPDGVLAWDAVLKALDVTNGQDEAHFFFDFTNVTALPLTVLDVHPSCGCTTAELPPTPWAIPAGKGGRIRLKVQVHGTAGTLFKSVTVKTDKGIKMLTLRINILPAPPMHLTEDEMQQGIMSARVDRQAVFHGKCADCHNKNLAGKYDHDLFVAACAICHEAEHRATMVPDLHELKVPTNEEFWRTWVAGGKPGSLMPAFSQTQGGPLNDMQIASLARYLNIVNPTKVPLPPAAK